MAKNPEITPDINKINDEQYAILLAHCGALQIKLNGSETLIELHEKIRNHYNSNLLADYQKSLDREAEIKDLEKNSEKLSRSDIIHLTDLRSRILIRARVTCNNTFLVKNQKGAVYTVCNQFSGIISRYVPFVGVESKSWHFPKILLNHLEERTFSSLYATDKIHQKTITDGGKPSLENHYVLTPEFNIQELPPLTLKELEALKKNQENLALGKE